VSIERAPKFWAIRWFMPGKSSYIWQEYSLILTLDEVKAAIEEQAAEQFPLLALAALAKDPVLTKDLP